MLWNGLPHTELNRLQGTSVYNLNEMLRGVL